VSLHLGDCLEVLRTLPDDSVDALVTDPPYALNFMGKTWDSPGKTVDASLGNWFAGFVDGEGCFRIHREKSGAYYACHFSIKLRRDDRPILERIARLTGVGRVFDEDHHSPDRPGAHPQAVYLVQDRDGCIVIRDFFQRFPLRAKKLREFREWSDALDDWIRQERGNRWHGASDKSAMERRWLRMKRLREYADPPWSGHGYQDWTREWAVELMRALKPGGHGLVFGGTRTYHRLVNGLEDAGFYVVDCLSWIYGQGFPKSKNLNGEWSGWGTALKPAHEPIVLIRKPLAAPNIASQVLATGTGALNIGASKIEHAGAADLAASQSKNPGRSDLVTSGTYGGDRPQQSVSTAGRWPANLVLSHSEGCRELGVRKVRAHWGQPTQRSTSPINRHAYGMTFEKDDKPIGYADPDGTETVTAWECAEGCPVAELDRQSGESVSTNAPSRGGKSVGGIMNRVGIPRDSYGTYFADSGGASRFFYTAKASTAERNQGLWNPSDRNGHPTVKPVSLMRYLCRLITPPSGTILDPFMGSGSTGVAARLEGFEFVGIEKDPESFETARKRLGWAVHQPGLFD